MIINEQNFTMLADFYEFTMANGYFENGCGSEIAIFDMFFRKIPDDGGFAIMMGVEQMIEYLKKNNPNIHIVYPYDALMQAKKAEGYKASQLVVPGICFTSSIQVCSR